MSESDQQAWFTHLRTNWGDNIMNGYAKIIPTPDIQSFNKKEGYNEPVRPHG